MTIVAIRSLTSPDIRELDAYRPENPADFGFLLRIIAGPAGAPGEESFDVVVCTPSWFASRMGLQPVSGRHHLFVREYDAARLRRFIESYVSGCRGATWQEAAERLARLAHWEFEDYRE
jgi:hypothetical protein